MYTHMLSMKSVLHPVFKGIISLCIARFKAPYDEDNVLKYFSFHLEDKFNALFLGVNIHVPIHGHARVHENLREYTRI